MTTTRIEVSTDGRSWAECTNGMDFARAHFLYVRTISFPEPKATVRHYRQGKCKTCGETLKQEATWGLPTDDPTQISESHWSPSKCRVCDSPLSRPERDKLKGRFLEAIEGEGEKELVLVFSGGTRIRIEAAGYDERILEIEVEEEDSK